MSQKFLQMPPRTFSAKLFRVAWESREFKIAGTLDGFIDLATPNGTYPLDLGEARELVEAIKSAVADVEKNCLYDSDVLRSR